MTKRRNAALRERYDPTEDWMPKVSALELSRRQFYAEHPDQQPAICPIAACGYRGQGLGRDCPNMGNQITGAYGTGAHGPAKLVPLTLRNHMESYR